MSKPCPCQSQKPDDICCMPYLRGDKSAETAEHLMRSRYTAYTLRDIDYIIKTTVPAQQALLDRTAMLRWSEQTAWAGLEIIRHQAKVDKTHAQVEFKAYFQTSKGREYHHELSTFVYIDNHWYFLDPTVPQFPAMKHPCICGSGKKFKQCCAVYLIA